MYTPIRKADLILGGTSIKQGEIFTLGFQLFDANGVLIIPAVGQTLTVKIANTTGVVHETTAVVVGDHIEFTVNVNIGAGKMRVELTVADGVNVLQKYPANGYIELLISASLDDIGTGNVYAVTAQIMRDEIAVIQSQVDVLVVAGDSSVEAAQARVDTANFTYTTLKARLDGEHTDVTSTLAEKSEYTYVDSEIAKKANGSPKGVYTTVANLQAAYPTGDTNNYIVVGNVAEVASLNVTASPTVTGNVTVTLNGVAKTVAISSGIAEVASLDVTAIPTSIGDVTVTLNGVAVNVALDPATDTTTDAVATKIRNTTFTGWTTGGTASNITFTATTKGVKTDAVYSAGTTGATGTISTTIQGVNADTTSEVATKIRNVAYTGWTTGGTGTTVTFTATSGGVKTDATYSGGTTGATGSMSTTTQGVDPDNNWYYWNGTAWEQGALYQSAGLADGSVTHEKTDFIILGDNLFNKNSPNLIPGTQLYYADGSQIANANATASHEFYLTLGETYIGYFDYPTFGGSAKAYFYDVNDTFVQSVVPTHDGSIGTFTVPTTANISYMRMNLKTATIGDVMLVKGAVYPSQYKPYEYKFDADYGLNSKQLEQAKDAVANVGNKLYGKISVYDGDSICNAINDAQDGWAGRISATNNMAYTSYAVDGGTITAELYADANPRHWVSRSVAGYRADADYIIFEGGTNDADLIGVANMGTISVGFDAVLDDTIFSGAVESTLKQAILKYPTKKIGFIIAHKMGALDQQNVRKPFFDRIMEICRKWGVDYINIWEKSYINPLLPDIKTIYYSDYQHLTTAGYDHITPLIEDWMKTL